VSLNGNGPIQTYGWLSPYVWLLTVELPPGDGATRVASLTLAHAPAPGVYIVHARQGTRAASQRMAVLPR
jgi:hypothetical protein